MSPPGFLARVDMGFFKAERGVYAKDVSLKLALYMNNSILLT